MVRFFTLALLAAGAALHAQTNIPTAPAVEPENDGKFVPEFAREAAAEGNAAFSHKDYERAARAYKKVLDLVPDNLVGLINLGVVDFYAGNFAESEAVLRRAVRIKLDAAPAWLTLGTMYMEQGKLDEALAALSQATLYDPRNARARNYLGVVIGRKGWIDGAQAELRKAVEVDPEYTDAHYNLAVFYLENKPPLIELARRHYFRALELGAEKDPEIEKTLNEAPAPTGGEESTK
jgi:tetratricopeptide (TPR) repeat protein